MVGMECKYCKYCGRVFEEEFFGKSCLDCRQKRLFRRIFRGIKKRERNQNQKSKRNRYVNRKNGSRSSFLHRLVGGKK